MIVFHTLLVIVPDNRQNTFMIMVTFHTFAVRIMRAHIIHIVPAIRIMMIKLLEKLAYQACSWWYFAFVYHAKEQHLREYSADCDFQGDSRTPAIQKFSWLAIRYLLPIIRIAGRKMLTHQNQVDHYYKLGYNIRG